MNMIKILGWRVLEFVIQNVYFQISAIFFSLSETGEIKGMEE